MVGIVGILASLILTAATQSRNKARDNNIKSDVRQLQLLAEIVYSQSSSYQNWTSNISDADAVTQLQNDIISHYGSGSGALIQQSQADNFCISAALIEGGYYCVDSDKEYVTTTGPCSSHQCPGS